jgi:hypothetical protein
VTATPTPSTPEVVESAESTPLETATSTLPAATPTSTALATWGPFVASSKPGISIVASGYERTKGWYGYPGVGAVGYNDGPEHFSIDVTFQAVKRGFVTQSTTETVAYIPANSFFAVGSTLEDNLGPDERLKVTFENGTLIHKPVPLDADVKTLITGDNVALNVTTDRNIPKGSVVYVVFTGANGEILGGSSDFTHVTMRAGTTTSDSLDGSVPPKGAKHAYVTVDRLFMM